MRAESPKSSIAQGNALGIRYLPTMRPVRATLIFHYFLQLPLQGALPLCIRLPRALPWAMKVIGLSARFVLLLPNPPIESSSYIKINMTTYLTCVLCKSFSLPVALDLILVLLLVGLDLTRKSSKVGLDLLGFSSDFGLDLKILCIFVIDL